MNTNDRVTMNDLERVALPVLELVTRKNADYGGSVFHHGLSGIYLRMTDKMERLKRLVWDQAQAQVTGESVADVFRDLIGYAALALVHMERQAQPAGAAEQDAAIKLMLANPDPFIEALKMASRIGPQMAGDKIVLGRIPTAADMKAAMEPVFDYVDGKTPVYHEGGVVDAAAIRAALNPHSLGYTRSESYQVEAGVPPSVVAVIHEPVDNPVDKQVDVVNDKPASPWAGKALPG